MLARFWEDESGATAIEYACIATMISIAIFGALRSIGSTLSTKYIQGVSSNLT